ncbi:unnamed protein product, partial [Pylaiella littoralis]
MWSYKYTSLASVFVDQCRVGARLETSTPTSQLVEFFSAVSKEQRCKCFFFDAGVEKHLASPFKTLIARPDRDRKGMFVGLTFPEDFPCHRSTKATSQRVSSFVHAMGLDALDLLVVPWPSGTQGHRALSDRGERHRDGTLFLKTWKALQRLVDTGAVRAIGVDRFLPWQLDFLIAQPGPKPVVNFLHISVTSHQEILTSYSHARQIEVVASLDTAKADTKAGASKSQRQTAASAGDEGEEAGTGKVVATDTIVGDGEATHKAALSAIALETDMTPAQVVTSWAMHRGLVALHTVGSLALSSYGMAPPPPQPAAVAARRGSSVGNTDLVNRVREAFALLHPLASRPVFYSPHKRFGFSLGPDSLEIIDAMDT